MDGLGVVGVGCGGNVGFGILLMVDSLFELSALRLMGVGFSFFVDLVAFLAGLAALAVTIFLFFLGNGGWGDGMAFSLMGGTMIND
jgi:hypothetical protein